MLTIIICTILAVTISAYRFSKQEYRDYSLCFFFGVTGLLIGILLSLIIGIHIPKKFVSRNIEALQDGQGVSGAFFLGCGNINGNMQYVFYYLGKDDMYHMDQRSYNRVSIEYYDGEPEVIFEEGQCGLWGIRMEGRDVVFRIPKGTIKSNYQLDAQ